jgi:hypothetical protein
MKSIGATATSSLALAGSASASDQENHLQEIGERANLQDPQNEKGDGKLNGEVPAAVGAEAPESVKREVRKQDSLEFSTAAVKSDTSTRDLPVNRCDGLEASTTMDGSFDSFYSYDGLSARWKSSGTTQVNATGCGFSGVPDEFRIDVETTVDGIEMTASIGGFGGGTTNNTNAASYFNSFSNEDDASHDYEEFVVKSPVALYNATQIATVTAVFNSDAYSTSARVTKA